MNGNGNGKTNSIPTIVERKYRIKMNSLIQRAEKTEKENEILSSKLNAIGKEKRWRVILSIISGALLIAVVIISIVFGNLTSDLRSQNSNKDSEIARLSSHVKEQEMEIGTLETNLSEAQASIADLESRNDLLRTNYNTLNTRFNTLNSEKKAIQRKLDFYEDHAVILPNDGSGVFHVYGCSKLSVSSFLIYNTEAALSKGYDPCTTCLTDGYYIGNASSGVYHRPTCWTLPAMYNRTYFETEEEATNRGYRPCSNCNP